MDFINLICPNSKSVWDGNKFSECFDDLVLGFGVNVITFIMVVVLGITKRKIKGRRLMNFPHKALYLIAALGACLSFLNAVMLLKKSLDGYFVLYHEWLFRCSQLSVWATILLFLTFTHCPYMFSDRVLCFWWILKFILGIPHLQTAFSSLEQAGLAYIILGFSFASQLHLQWSFCIA